MARRKALSKAVRFEVFKRDSFKCQYCGRSAPDVILEADHIDPVSKGGGDDLANLVTSCFDCNRGKAGRKLSDTSVAAKSRAQLAELQERRDQIDMMLEWRSGLRNLDDDTVTKLESFWAKATNTSGLNEYALGLLRKLLKQFTVAEIAAAMDVAVDQYEDVSDAFHAIGGICRVAREETEDPGIKELYYIRGIFRKRMKAAYNHYGHDWVVMRALKGARARGAAIADLRQLAVDSRCWTHFLDDLDAAGAR